MRRTDVDTHDCWCYWLGVLQEWIEVRSIGECGARDSQLDCRRQAGVPSQPPPRFSCA
jgi:hypothetical protein